MNKKLKSLLVVIISVIGAICYRMGGSGNFARFVRPLGQAICVVLIMLILGMIHWSLVLCFGLTWLETTYFKKKDTDAAWWNWALVGLVFGIIPLPYEILSGKAHWVGFGIRVPVCTGLTVFWQQSLSAKVAKILNVGKDITDEFGRGFINLASLPLLLI